MGRVKFVFFYLLGGFAAMALQIAVDPSTTVPSVGASGAVAAVLGGYLLLYPRARVLTLIFLVVFFTFIEIPAMWFLLIWFGEQLLFGYFNQVDPTGGGGGVAYFAHIGGFLFGVLTVRLLATRYNPDYQQRFPSTDARGRPRRRARVHRRPSRLDRARRSHRGHRHPHGGVRRRPRPVRVGIVGACCILLNDEERARDPARGRRRARGRLRPPVRRGRRHDVARLRGAHAAGPGAAADRQRPDRGGRPRAAAAAAQAPRRGRPGPPALPRPAARRAALRPRHRRGALAAPARPRPADRLAHEDDDRAHRRPARAAGRQGQGHQGGARVQGIGRRRAAARQADQARDDAQRPAAAVGQRRGDRPRPARRAARSRASSRG